MNELTQESGLGIATIERKGDIAVATVAEKAKALVQAKFLMALHKPRNIMNARAEMIEACKRPQFASVARYKKPVGKGQFVEGPSIRFAETAIQAMRNIDVSSQIIFEDDEKVIMHIEVLDLETCTSYGDDATIKKTVERRSLKEFQEAISKRTNSTGDTVYLVYATEDEIRNKMNAAKSRIIRDSGLRLVPRDIVDDAMAQVKRTMVGEVKDPKAEIKKVCDAFSTLNVRPSDLEVYLGHTIENISPDELDDLRTVFSTIKDGEAKWADYVADKKQLPTVAPDGTPQVNQPARRGRKPKLEPIASAEQEDNVPMDTNPSAPPQVIDVTPDPKPINADNESTGATQAVPNEDLPDLDNPFSWLIDQLKKEGITERQVIIWCRKQKLASDTQTELTELASHKIKQLATSWHNIKTEIKAIK